MFKNLFGSGARREKRNVENKRDSIKKILRVLLTTDITDDDSGITPDASKAVNINALTDTEVNRFFSDLKSIINSK